MSTFAEFRCIDDNLVFLPPEEILAHPGTIRVGDSVRVLRDRRVVRVGYRKRPKDYDVGAFLQEHPEARAAYNAFVHAFGLGHRSKRKVVEALQFALANKDRFGGRARGVVVDMRGVPDKPLVLQVLSVEYGRVGNYYSGSSPSAPYYDDGEGPGLGQAKTVVICRLSSWNSYLSGDLEKVLPEKP